MKAKSRKSPEPTYTLIVRALADEVPPIIRLRHFLKAALRSYNLRCVSVTEGSGHALPPIDADLDVMTTEPPF